jgi:hypothetical protein
MIIIPPQPAGITTDSLASELGIKYATAKKRLEYAGIKPMYSFGNKGAGVYPLSALDAIRDMKRGRPKKSPDGV